MGQCLDAGRELHKADIGMGCSVDLTWNMVDRIVLYSRRS